MDEKLELMKNQYNEIPIPAELDFIVKKAIKRNIKRKGSFTMKWLAGVGAAAVIFTAGVNSSPALAQTLSKVPIVGSLVKVITFREFKIDEETYKANLQVPAIVDLESNPVESNPVEGKSLENDLNSQYIEENKKLYEEFQAEMESLKQNGGGHIGIESGYIVKTDNDRILSIGRYIVNTVGSSSTTFKYDTIDKKNQVLITLPSLFKDDRYISIISTNIIEQMKKQMMEDKKKAYWVTGVPNEVNSYFEAISKNQSFYINNKGNLVISFNKYEVAPGYMGIEEFVIPTNVLSDVLVSDEYLR